MSNMIHFSSLFLVWRARRAGSLDGRSLIPQQHDAAPPTYLFYLRGIGHWRAARLASHWHLHNLFLLSAYVKALRMYEQAQQVLHEVELEYADAEARRKERGTDKHITALKRCGKARERARRRVDRVELAVTAARARRQAKWEGYGARFHALAAEMAHYMQIYSVANVKARDDNDCPPGLLEANRPRLDTPKGLCELGWGVPSRPPRMGENDPAMDA